MTDKTQTTRTALSDLLYALSQQDPFNSEGGVEFEGRYIGSDERGRILLSRAVIAAKKVLKDS